MRKIEEYFLPAMSLVGLRTVTAGALMSDVTEDGPIAQLWDTLLARTGPLPHPTLRYGLVRGLADGHVEYVACVRAGEMDDTGLTPIEFEGGYFLCAEHVGPLASLSDSVRWFYEEYVPSSGYQLRAGWHVEIFDPRFDPANPESILTFGAPAQRSTSEQ
jgi:AraC family transcriptional regulator